MYIVEVYKPIERGYDIDGERAFVFAWKPVRNFCGLVRKFKTKEDATAFMQKKYDIKKDNVRVSELT